MSHRFTGRLGRLEARQIGSVGDREQEFARDRALQERVRACVKEDPELYTRYQNALDAFLDAEEGARVRGEDPEDNPEVLEAIRAYEQIERLLLGEEDEDDERRRK